MAKRAHPDDGRVADAIRLALALAGIGLVATGAWLIYPAAGLIAAGAMLFGVVLYDAVWAK